jgi:hypothetical protein
MNSGGNKELNLTYKFKLKPIQEQSNTFEQWLQIKSP